jgi:hypothetical protein
MGTAKSYRMNAISHIRDLERLSTVVSLVGLVVTGTA